MTYIGHIALLLQTADCSKATNSNRTLSNNINLQGCLPLLRLNSTPRHSQQLDITPILGEPFYSLVSLPSPYGTTLTRLFSSSNVQL